MESIATGVSNLLASLDVDATRELRIALNNQRFKDAVMGAWADNPDAALYVLAHTNSLYVEKDTAPRKGRDKDRDHVVLGVYLDDSLARWRSTPAASCSGSRSRNRACTSTRCATTSPRST